ncbi:MAG: response regulator [Gammaproteobacteria bacterium]
MDKKKILLIDDEPHVTSVISHFLIRSGYDVETANNGLVALDKVSKRMPDVIISDIQMPKLTGLGFCERFRTDFSESESLIIIMTSRTERDFREKAGSLENVEFFEKPLSPRKIVARLKEYFEEMETVD